MNRLLTVVIFGFLIVSCSDSKIKKKGFFTLNVTELVFLLEHAYQTIIDAVIASKPKKRNCFR